MAKYEEQFKIKVVQAYLQGTDGFKSVARRYEVPHSMVRRWVGSFRAHGVNGLRRQSGSYSAAFKQSVLIKIRREGLSDTQAAVLLGIRHTGHITKWRAQYDAGGIEALARKRPGASMPHKYPPEPVSKDMTKEELEQELAYLRAENDYLKKMKALRSGEDPSAGWKAQVVQGLRPKHPLALLLRVAKLSRSTFYYHLKSFGAVDPYTELKQRISAVYARHKGRYGYRRITAVLRQTGELVNHKTVQKLMQALGLKSLVRAKKYRSYRGQSHHVAANVLARDFEAARPNQKWVTDVTEFNVRGEKLYLSPVMDLYNGEIVAYETSRRPVFKLVGSMLKKALARLLPTERPVLHSDQGWQYQQPNYRQILASRSVTQSMSRKGNCLDNAAMESFFGTLKAEFFHLNRFESIDQLQTGIRQYIRYYNHDRIKLKLKGLSPVQYRVQAFGL
ncbi:IS3 family transposase [Klebsiella pneumoniae]|uniref:IS3 family transposase n=1 Tax=Klebsiella pneumoniae TaxID=573 RepID=UPI00237E60D4|nr:IS3 family transposase [Klebsiella pneumoniae]MDE1754636.1 IS3 family transposase [Klebsiella pneumoniae subsp. pneumoniae]